jgi:curved DNA-binding protein CbpA
MTDHLDPDHEIFRLRDDVIAHEGANTTFYSFLGVTRKATIDEINRAYRKRSMRLHPDKARQTFINERKKAAQKAPSRREVDAYHKEASERFARLGVITNILRGENRERYDFFLDHGFPMWRGTGYYYQRYRPGAGTVLIGLFIVMGGFAHYGALVLSWKRQRTFAHKYILDARKLAWGNSMVVPGLDTVAPVAAPAAAPSSGSESAALNRRQKRLQEKENKKNAKKGITPDDISEPAEPVLISGPQGSKRRVVAENGKVLIVDSVGNVFLEDTTPEGETHEFLIDVSSSGSSNHRPQHNFVCSSPPFPRANQLSPRSTRSPSQPCTTPSSSVSQLLCGTKPADGSSETTRPRSPRWTTQKPSTTVPSPLWHLPLPRTQPASRNGDRKPRSGSGLEGPPPPRSMSKSIACGVIGFV